MWLIQKVTWLKQPHSNKVTFPFKTKTLMSQKKKKKVLEKCHEIKGSRSILQPLWSLIFTEKDCHCEFIVSNFKQTVYISYLFHWYSGQEPGSMSDRYQKHQCRNINLRLWLFIKMLWRVLNWFWNTISYPSAWAWPV